MRFVRFTTLSVLAASLATSLAAARTTRMDVQHIQIIPAPALTPDDIEKLKHVKEWDLEFTGYQERTASGSGMFGTPPFTTEWSHLHETRKSYHVKARIAGKLGPSDCRLGSSSNPCVVKYLPDTKVEVTEYKEHVHDTTDSTFGCGFMLMDPLMGYTDVSIEGQAGSYVADGTPGKLAIGDVQIDYSENPPIAYGNVYFDSTPYHQTQEYSSCGQTQHFEGDNVGFLDTGWWPPASGCCEDGDSQIRIEHGAFVVHGASDWTFQGDACVVGNSPHCLPPDNQQTPYFGHEHFEWTLREHDCRDTNGNGNSDDDGDGLCDNWETEGLDVDGDGTIDLPLNKPPYNADPEHKDLFVEVDYMQDPNHREKPTNAALNMVKNAFAFAPVTNPDGLRGVRLHFVGSDAANPDPRKLVDEALPHSNRIAFPEDIAATCPATSFNDLKKSDFGTAAERADANTKNILEAKARVFRYAIFAHQQADTVDSSGSCADNGSSGVAELPGNDLIVTVGGPDWRPYGSGAAAYSGGGAGACFSGERAEKCAERHVDAATFMHEFGHTLGLHHGGSDDTNCKPNYLSLMNYSFQFRDVVSTRPLDYSGGVAAGFANDPFAPLDETNLSEPAGITGPLARNSVFGLNGRDAYLLLNHPIDWNADPNGRTDETGVIGDVARRDANAGCSRGDSVDAQNVTVQASGSLNPNSVPAPGAFTIHVNGTSTITPTSVAVTKDRLYLSLPSPAAAGDTFKLDYTKPATNPLQDDHGFPFNSFSDRSIPNITGELKTLIARDDWATLQYDMRGSVTFDDGTPRQPQDGPEMTAQDAVASASGLDFDGDGVANAFDNCPAVYNPGQDDLDGDGFGDDCEPTQAPDDDDPVSVGVVSPAPNGAGWNSGDVAVNLTAADDPNGSGIREIDYVLSGAQSEPAQAVVADAVSPIVSTEGETAVKFFAVDNFGNPEMPNTVTVRIDRTPPAITASQDPPPNASGWNNTDVTVTYTCADALSGLASCDTPAVITNEGQSQSATGAATDVAGNAAQVSVNGINIDRTPPSVTCSVTPSVLWPPKHKMIPIQATVGVTDTLSGEGTDQAGNAASCTATVTVPKKKPR
ncbi:MAG: hypothetical protein HY049_08690 [Acidobacteria bacterium]|nr:hypothetical protein [Acidobacteriota bacterium]